MVIIGHSNDFRFFLFLVIKIFSCRVIEHEVEFNAKLPFRIVIKLISKLPFL